MGLRVFQKVLTFFCSLDHSKIFLLGKPEVRILIKDLQMIFQTSDVGINIGNKKQANKQKNKKNMIWEHSIFYSIFYSSSSVFLLMLLTFEVNMLILIAYKLVKSEQMG